MEDKPKHGEIRFSQTMQGDACRLQATMYFDPRLVYDTRRNRDFARMEERNSALEDAARIAASMGAQWLNEAMARKAEGLSSDAWSARGTAAYEIAAHIRAHINLPSNPSLPR